MGQWDRRRLVNSCQGQTVVRGLRSSLGCCCQPTCRDSATCFPQRSDVTASRPNAPHRPSASSDPGTLPQPLGLCNLSCFHESLHDRRTVAAGDILLLSDTFSTSQRVSPWETPAVLLCSQPFSLLTLSMLQGKTLGLLMSPTQHAATPGPARTSSEAMTKTTVFPFISGPQFAPLDLPVTIIIKKPDKDPLPRHGPCQLHEVLLGHPSVAQ